MPRRLITRSFLAVALVLIAIEGASRLWMTDIFSGRFEYGYHPTAGFIEHPDGSIELRRTGGRHFYPQQFNAIRPAGTLRIITIGDSISRGATLEQSYPWLLGEELRRDGYAVEALNFSVPGYGARRKMIVLRQALQYQPDLVVLHLGMSNEFEDERDAARARDAASWHPRNWLMKSYLIRRLYEYKTEYVFLRWLPAQIRAQTYLSDAIDEGTANLSAARRAAWRVTFTQATDQSLRLIAAQRIPLILVPRVVLAPAGHPAGQPAGQPAGLKDDGVTALVDGLIAARPRGDGPSPADPQSRITWLQPGDVLGPNPSPELFGGDRIHWKPEAHQLFARALAKRIEADRAREGAGVGPGVQKQ